MSDSSLSASPDDAVLEQGLRQIVGELYDSGNLDDLTVNGVRIAAQENLGLRKGFFKEADWKERSKAIIEDEAVYYSADTVTFSLVSKHVQKVRNNVTKSSSVSLPVKMTQKPPNASSRPVKRASPDEAAPRKRQKLRKEQAIKKNNKTAIDESDEDEDVAKRKKAQRKSTKEHSPSLSDVDDDVNEPKDVSKNPISPAQPAAESSESEMSVLIDEEAKPKRRKKGNKEPKHKTEPKKRGRKSIDKQELDPDTEEIKRLRSWLVKCGIRKMWARELKPYDTPKEKIRHLKEMLADAGMTGRYSTEKAAKIRETRELKADLEAIQAFDKRWGNVEEEEEEEERPKRRSTGIPNFDFLESESE
ncbi:MAG: hypothetical protein LQ340_003672 [Diploschistes diacapsis]|nr:MAG: hypothetical protein LQ340_003672 [Diploschistes diacapsis]